MVGESEEGQVKLVQLAEAYEELARRAERRLQKPSKD
jgi:hypothetical protein